MVTPRYAPDPTLPARCEPERPCAQHDQCARIEGHRLAFVIDASLYHRRTGLACPLFIDKRGTALKQQ